VGGRHRVPSAAVGLRVSAESEREGEDGSLGRAKGVGDSTFTNLLLPSLSCQCCDSREGGEKWDPKASSRIERKALCSANCCSVVRGGAGSVSLLGCESSCTPF
jgi:hypothetical protein